MTYTGVEPDDCTATVEVVDAETGDPIEDVSVRAEVNWQLDLLPSEWVRGTTGGDGTVDIDGPCGVWPLTGSDTDYRANTETVRVDGDHDEPITLELVPFE